VNRSKEKRRVLLFTDWFLPGFKGGGPIQSIAGMIENLSDDVEFYVVTRDRDLGDSAQYPSIEPEVWSNFGLAKVYYWPPGLMAKIKLLASIRRIQYEIMYLNGVFSLASTIFPLICCWLGLLRSGQLIIAPRGELSVGALGIKSAKKRAFLAVAKAVGWYDKAQWHVSSKFEKGEIIANFGPMVKSVTIAPNLSPRSNIEHHRSNMKVPGAIKLVTISRISRKKNIDYTLKLLMQVKGKLSLDIFGPCEDERYWRECQALMEKLKKNITVRYMGEVSHDHVMEALVQYDYFIFPTLGENYGHVIREALASGLPVIISDRTPWRDLQKKGVGWDLPLENPELFVNVIEKCIEVGNDKYQKCSAKAREYAILKSNPVDIILANREIFTT